MKCHLTRREALALVVHIVNRPTKTLEEREARLTAWSDLGVEDLAAEIVDAATIGAAPPDGKVWADNKVPILVDLQDATVRFLLKNLEGEVAGMFSDLLAGIHRRLLRLEAKTYELPQVLKAVG